MNAKMILLFDGVCNLCNSSVRFVHKRAKNPSDFIYHSLQSEQGTAFIEKYNIKADTGSVVVIVNDKAYLKSSAAIQIVPRLKFPYSLLIIFWIIPKFLRDVVYDFVARNRYKWFGKRKEVCEFDPTFNAQLASLKTEV